MSLDNASATESTPALSPAGRRSAGPLRALATEIKKIMERSFCPVESATDRWRPPVPGGLHFVLTCTGAKCHSRPPWWAMDVHPAVMEALVRRCEDGQIGPFLAQGDGCGWCRHPVRLRGHQDAVDTVTGSRTVVFSSASAPDGVVLKGCGNRRQSRCRTCATIYRADARHLVRAGLESYPVKVVGST